MCDSSLRTHRCSTMGFTSTIPPSTKVISTRFASSLFKPVTVPGRDGFSSSPLISTSNPGVHSASHTRRNCGRVYSC